MSYSPWPASGSGSDEEDDDDEEESSSQSEGEEDEEESVSGSGRSEQSAGETVKNCSTNVTHVAGPVTQHHRSNIVASFLSEDVSEEEQSVEDFEEEKENGNHIPSGE